jgi:hypothetical protein
MAGLDPAIQAVLTRKTFDTVPDCKMDGRVKPHS